MSIKISRYARCTPYITDAKVLVWIRPKPADLAPGEFAIRMSDTEDWIPLEATNIEVKITPALPD